LKRERNTTMQDVAELAGVSKVTVSAILGGRSTKLRIAEATQLRVRKAAEDLSYHPNAIARSLRQQRTNILGFYSAFITHNAANDFLGAVIGGLQTACYEYEQDILLHRTCTGRPANAIFNEMVDGRIDGIFLHASHEDPLTVRLAASSLPVVGIADYLPGIASVSCDNEAGMTLLVDYLWKRGHRCIAFLSTRMKLPSVEIRANTFQQEMLRRGASPEQSPVLKADMDTEHSFLRILLSLNPTPTALCCWHDGAAYQILRGCYALGVRVPEDLAIVGFNGFLDRLLPIQNLVSIDAGWSDVAEAAMKIMIEQISGAEVEQETRTPVHLIPGDTA